MSLDVDGCRIEVRGSPGRSPALVWLGGFRSDMDGTKAQAMVANAARQGHASLRFDYSGHGRSGGRFEDGTISRWVGEAAAVLDAYTDAPPVLVGSSMGAWIALRLSQMIPLAGLVLIAPAPDFTSELMEPAFTDEQRATMVRDGFILEPSDYSPEPNTITAALIEDGAKNRVLVPGLKTGCPVAIVQGTADPDVPHAHAEKLAALIAQDVVTFTSVQGGDHRLSRDEDIALIDRITTQMLKDVAS